MSTAWSREAGQNLAITSHMLINLHPLQYIQSTCATSGDGLYEGLEWLANTLRKAGHQ